MTTKSKLAVPTKAQFRAYLQGLAGNVSRFCKTGNCPLGQYIAENSTGLGNRSRVSVDTSIRVIDGYGVVVARRVVPKWAKQFTENVDFLDSRKANALDYPTSWSAITPYEALVALDYPCSLALKLEA